LDLLELDDGGAEGVAVELRQALIVEDIDRRILDLLFGLLLLEPAGTQGRQAREPGRTGFGAGLGRAVENAGVAAGREARDAQNQPRPDKPPERGAPDGMGGCGTITH